MSPEIIRLLGLISLRALAEYDPPEYWRATDMSKRQLSRRIESLLQEVENPECERLYAKLNEFRESSESPIELSLLLHQIYLESSGMAEYLSLQRSRQERANDYIEDLQRDSRQEKVQRRPVSEGDELIRLSTFLLLRDLEGYRFSFHRRYGEVEIDAVLEPESQGMPIILIQSAASGREFETKLVLLKSAMAQVPGPVMGIVVTEGTPAYDGQEGIEERVLLLRFDIRKNQFSEDDLRRVHRNLGKRSGFSETFG